MITALSNSLNYEPYEPSRATQDRWVIVESSDKVWSSGEGNGKPLQHSCLENSISSMKREKDTTLKDKLPRSVGAQHATGESGEIASEGMKRPNQSINNVLLWMCLMVAVKSNYVKNNIVKESGMLGP